MLVQKKEKSQFIKKSPPPKRRRFYHIMAKNASCLYGNGAVKLDVAAVINRKHTDCSVFKGEH